MATSAPTPLRQVLEERVRQLVLETESLFTEARDRARRDMADQLNQAVRRIRQSTSLDDLAATLTDAAAPFCAQAALFWVEGEWAAGVGTRGVPDRAAEEFAALRIPLSDAPALKGVVESRDPVVAAATAGEVSERLMSLLQHDGAGRVSIYPVASRDGVGALLYVWGAPQGPALELLAQVASSVWTALTEPAPEPVSEPVGAAATASDGLVQIAVPSPVVTPDAPVNPGPKSWEQLPLDEQRVHLKAQRFARVQVSEMRLFEPEAVQSGRTNRDLYDALRRQIDAARETFRNSFFAQCPSMLDYLHVELVRTLANDDPELLGGDYPGPLV